MMERRRLTAVGLRGTGIYNILQNEGQAGIFVLFCKALSCKSDSFWRSGGKKGGDMVE